MIDCFCSDSFGELESSSQNVIDIPIETSPKKTTRGKRTRKIKAKTTVTPQNVLDCSDVETSDNEAPKKAGVGQKTAFKKLSKLKRKFCVVLRRIGSHGTMVRCYAFEYGRRFLWFSVETEFEIPRENRVHIQKRKPSGSVVALFLKACGGTGRWWSIKLNFFFSSIFRFPESLETTAIIEPNKSRTRSAMNVSIREAYQQKRVKRTRLSQTTEVSTSTCLQC